MIQQNFEDNFDYFFKGCCGIIREERKRIYVDEETTN
jgi:hypothetical protein